MKRIGYAAACALMAAMSIGWTCRGEVGRSLFDAAWACYWAARFLAEAREEGR